MTADLVELREILDSDIDVFFDQQLDEQSNWMAGYAMENPRDYAGFRTHWTKMMSDASFSGRTILWNDQVAGHVLCVELLSKPSVAYWIGKEYWGRGIATEGVRQFVGLVPTRPLYARVLADNHGSIRVLEKVGFIREGTAKCIPNIRKAEFDELIFRLDAPAKSRDNRAAN